jgi:Xaa-Pro aminopeptidase
LLDSGAGTALNSFVPNHDELAQRRARFLKEMGGGLALIPSAPTAIRNNDVEHDYRQDSDLFYLTGFDEPDSVLLLRDPPHEAGMVMFVRPRDPERETWDGPRAGVDGAREQFGADAAHPIAELAKKLPDYLSNVNRLHYRVGDNRAFDEKVFAALREVRGRARKGVTPPREIVDTGAILHEMRLRKSPDELATMRKAAAITAEAHGRAFEIAKPGVYEYEVEAELLRVFRSHGAERPAYGSIVASGPNATVLHHRRNDRRMEQSDLLLIDAGAEYGYLASDVTRTFPVSGRFTEAQRAIYDVVLAAQHAAIEAVRPGATFMAPHERALEVLTEGMIELGLIEGPTKDAIKDERYKPYYMHRTSHWLGMDVHDVGDYHVDGKSRPLEPGMVLTIEPGLYVSVNAECDAKWRGIGVRIEDDVAVTEDGCEVITAAIPKAPDELERLLAARAS